MMTLMAKPRSYRLPVTEDEIRALERYRLNAHLVRLAFHRHWEENPNPSRAGRGDPADPAFFGWMSLWYSTVCVVAEGCMELNIELNLKEDLVDEWKVPLKRFRNKTFHRQNEFPPRAMIDYIEREDSVAWVYALSAEVGVAIRREGAALGMRAREDGFYL